MEARARAKADALQEAMLRKVLYLTKLVRYLIFWKSTRKKSWMSVAAVVDESCSGGDIVEVLMKKKVS